MMHLPGACRECDAFGGDLLARSEEVVVEPTEDGGATGYLAAGTMVCLRRVLAALVASSLACAGGSATTSPLIAQPDAPATSPDQRHVLSTIAGQDPSGEFIRIEVAAVSPSGAVPVFTSEELWYSRHRTVAGWDEQGAVWVYSGDVGVTVYSEATPGIWTPRTWTAGQTDAPDWLRTTAPVLFR